MIKRCIFSILLASSASVFACGLHQSTGFNMAIEEGSLEVFANVIEVRQSDEFNNVNKPDHFRLFSFKSALGSTYANKLNFSIFEAIKGHYSDVYVESSVQVVGKDVLPTESEVLLVTELDVLDALASGSLSWSSAKERNLVRVNGPEHKRQALDNWFGQIF